MAARTPPTKCYPWRDEIEIRQSTIIGPLIERLRRDRRLAIAIIGAVLVGLVLSLVTDTIRLGPSEVALPTDAMSLTTEFIRIPDGDASHDYYYLVVTVGNSVTDPSIQPYEADVTLRTNPTADTMVHYPWVGDHDGPLILAFADIERTFTFPAGVVGYEEPNRGIAHWSVHGESFLKSRPIFQNQASFVIKVRIEDGAELQLSSIITLT